MMIPDLILAEDILLHHQMPYKRSNQDKIDGKSCHPMVRIHQFYEYNQFSYGAPGRIRTDNCTDFKSVAYHLFRHGRGLCGVSTRCVDLERCTAGESTLSFDAIPQISIRHRTTGQQFGKEFLCLHRCGLAFRFGGTGIVGQCQ